MICFIVASPSGLSPRVRGNRAIVGTLINGTGSIPACAGEPSRGARPEAHAGVYPRVCGGTPPTMPVERGTSGLSPRVRGNRSKPLPPSSRGGSIPACAGEPAADGHAHQSIRVYPRVCGGTASSWCCRPAATGLSPRVRGNPLAPRRSGRRRGSIPACAGEPAASSPIRCSSRVYPRVCGGTGVLFGHGIRDLGLSPRVRGNRRGPASRTPNRGSIPACAGEPTGDWISLDADEVYPRVCGGTPVSGADREDAGGLSPRVRGNPLCFWPCTTAAGSIPACAGEPHRVVLLRPVGRVYPRVCGGTFRSNVARSRATGLSPRVRGNRALERIESRLGRSIPACAGEPSSPAPRRVPARVYPRVCGGTMPGDPPARSRSGLSPRVRGNPRAAP